jgi:hypothetical protein
MSGRRMSPCVVSGSMNASFFLSFSLSFSLLSLVLRTRCMIMRENVLVLAMDGLAPCILILFEFARVVFFGHREREMYFLAMRRANKGQISFGRWKQCMMLFCR